jgi:hypothetical protein
VPGRGGRGQERRNGDGSETGGPGRLLRLLGVPVGIRRQVAETARGKRALLPAFLPAPARSTAVEDSHHQLEGRTGVSGPGPGGTTTVTPGHRDTLDALEVPDRLFAVGRFSRASRGVLPNQLPVSHLSHGVTPAVTGRSA